jgi:hypothetical protein
LIECDVIGEKCPVVCDVEAAGIVQTTAELACDDLRNGYDGVQVTLILNGRAPVHFGRIVSDENEAQLFRKVWKRRVDRLYVVVEENVLRVPREPVEKEFWGAVFFAFCVVQAGKPKRMGVLLQPVLDRTANQERRVMTGCGGLAAAGQCYGRATAPSGRIDEPAEFHNCEEMSGNGVTV